MTLYIESELLLDSHCRNLNICDPGIDNEYLIISSNDRCSCPKRRAVLCKYVHDSCRTSCSSEQILYIKQQNQQNEISINNSPGNIVLLHKDELEHNPEIVHICQNKNLPKIMREHLNNKLSNTNISSINLTLTKV